MKIYLDGRFVDEADAKVSVFDHGLLYGDGIFEGIRLYGGNVFRLDEHLERFENSAKAILLDLPLTRAEWSHAVCETCRERPHRRVHPPGRHPRRGRPGPRPWLCSKPSYFVIASKISLYPAEHYENGLAIVTVPTRGSAPGPCRRPSSRSTT
jgi:branched-chain amino acid aminotransferase